MHEELIKKIRRKEANISVIGLGHVGLVTATMFAKSGFQVVGVDIKPDVVELVSSGKSHVREPELEKLIREAVRRGKLKAIMDTQQAFSKSDVGIVCVQTPLTKDKQPDLSLIHKACVDIAESLSKGKLVVIESSVPPGTTKSFVSKILESGSKLKCGRDFCLAHCPERIAVGNAEREFTHNPRIVGGYDETSTKIAVELFKKVTKGEILPTDCTTAEVAKLAENTFRDVNIAFANELALICEEIGTDVVDVIKLANTHPRVKIHNPGCGVGGPCITKDPFLLLDSARKRDSSSKLILPSRELNEYMPKHTVALVIKSLKKLKKEIRNSKIAILGVAYKGEIDDARNSPAETIIRELMKLGAKTVVYDPYALESFGAIRASDLVSAVEEADCMVVVTEHKMFKRLKLKKLKAIMKENPVIVDGRRLVNPVKAKKQGFRYVGIGCFA